FNVSSNYILPANTPIGIYINESFVQTAYTQNDILPDSSENGSMVIAIPESTEGGIEVVLIINIAENGIVIKGSSESYVISIIRSPLFNQLEDLVSCNTGNQTTTFDFTEYEYLVRQNDSDTISFYSSYEDASLNINPVFDTSSYTTQVFPKEIFVRIDNG